MNNTQPARSRHNSIAFLRVALALSVLVSHGYGLAKVVGEPLSTFSEGRISFGTFGVAGFFALSGYLISRSYATASSPFRYLWHRLLRIFPGYWICLLLVAFVVGPVAHVMAYGTLSGYFGVHTWSVGNFLRGNALLLLQAHRIDAVFAHNPVAYSVDESLWTLEVEFRCYLAVMLLGLLRNVPAARLAYAAIPAGLLYLYVADRPEFARNLLVPHPSYLMPYVFFAMGAALFVYSDSFTINGRIALVAGLVSLLCMHFGGMRLLLPLSWPYVLMYLAEALPFRRFDRHGDFSYGIYIYAFPMQQLVVLAGVPRFGVVFNILATLALTLPIAFLSWHLVEGPSLEMKSWRPFWLSKPAPNSIRAPRRANEP